MTAARRRAWLVATLLACAGCSRASGSVDLLAAFSDDTVVGQLTARWDESGEERAGATPDGRDCKVAFHVDALNRLSDRLYLRLRDFHLIGRDGTHGAGEVGIECALAPGTTHGVLAGVDWVPCNATSAIRGFRVDHFAVPLSERGQSFYREFLLRQRPADAAAIDAEIAAFAAAPTCRGAD
jgi:hypothetical protein